MTVPAGALTPAGARRPSLTVALLGGLQIQQDGCDLVARLPGRQGRALVAYLVLNQDRPVSRDELLDVLWPSTSPAAPDAALNSVLAKVRRVLGPGVITGRQTLVMQLTAAAEIDVRAVGPLVERAEHALSDRDPATALDAAQAALEMLALPLLPDLEGDWVDTWRQRFDGLIQRALEMAAQAGLALGAGHLSAAERAAGALVAREPFREGAYALLMQAQARQGNVAQALRTFERLRMFLRDELGACPSAALVALHEALVRGDLPASVPGAQAAAAQDRRVLPTVTSQMIEGTFVGRDESLQRLRVRWQQSQAGQTRLVLLVGEAGVGKTRLAAEFAEEVQATGGMVLYGRADEEALLPHQPFVEALRQLVTRADAAVAAAAQQDREILWRLLPDLAPPGHVFVDGAAHGEDHTLRYRLFEAVTGLLCTASRESPLLLILDDLHWADKSTLLLLRHLLRQLRLTDLLIVGTFRHVEVGRDHPLVGLLSDLRRERRYDRLTLGGLDHAATALLVADRLGRDASPEFVHRLREQTDGNAFFIEETIRALIDSGLPADEAITDAALEQLGVPEGVSEIVRRRVGHLSPLAAEVLTAASVVGRDFRLGIVAQIADESADQVMGALEESMAAGLVLESPDRIDVFAFSHALVREVLYGGLSASRRVRLHHYVATALEAADTVNPAELAHHFMLARHFTGPGPARRYAVAAGDRATQLLAYDEAVVHYEQAVTLFEDDDEAARCEVLLALGRTQWRAGTDAARHTFRTAANSAARRHDADQLARAALGHSARYHEAGYAGARDRELLEEALAALGEADSMRRVLVLSRLAENVAFAAEQREWASALIDEALAMARRLGDENVLLAALMARHATLLSVRHLDERLKLSEEFMGLRIGHRELLAERHHWRLYDLLESAHVDAARAEQPQLEMLTSRLRQPQWQSITAGWRGIWAELAGDVEGAERCAEECLQCGQRAQMKDALSTWAAKLLMLRHRQGRLHELADVVQRLVSGADMRKTGWPSALGLILAEVGDEGAARDIYRTQLLAYPDALPAFWLTNAAMLSELCVRLHDPAGARTLYEALAPYAERNVVVSYASCWGPVERYLALLAATYGDDEGRRDHARRALARTQAMNAPLLTRELEERHGDLRTA